MTDESINLSFFTTPRVKRFGDYLLAILSSAILILLMTTFCSSAGAATVAKGKTADIQIARANPNELCTTAPTQTGTAKLCVDSWSNGITATYTSTPSGAQYASWNPGPGNSAPGNQTTFSCAGPNFSVFIPLTAGEWLGVVSLITDVLQNSPALNYDLLVGGSNTTPAPPTSCNPPPPPPQPTGTVDPPVVGMASTPDGQGYWLVAADGSVAAHGDATWYGDLPSMGIHPNLPIVGIAPSYSSNGRVNGYWEDATDGGIFAFGGAPFYGSMGGKPLNKPMVSMAATPDGQGYWTVAADGGIFSFGNAQFYGSTGSIRLNQPVVGMATDYANGGYWMVASDGGIFAFNAPFLGSTGSIHLNKPIIEMEAAPDGSGYRFVASDGGVFSFNLPFDGSLGGAPPPDPIAGMAPSGTNGYWVVEQNGTVHSFGSAPSL